MMLYDLSLDQIYAQMSHYLLVMARVSALLHTSPIFSEKSVSARLRAGLTLLITLLLGSLLPNTGIELFAWEGIWTFLKQLVIGFAMGLTIQFLFSAVRLSGEIIGMQMGLSFATFFEPGSGSSPVISRILNVLATLLFLAFDGHLWMISMLAKTFYILPVTADPIHAGGMLFLVSHAGLIFSQGLILGMPIIALLLCVNLILALLNRLTPQLSIFVIGFPLTLSFGMVALLLMIQNLSPFIEHLMVSGFDNLQGLLNALAWY